MTTSPGALGPASCQCVFNTDIHYALETTADYSAYLALNEKASIAGMSAGRLATYSTGRYLAHTVLAEVGFPGADLARGDDREPLWPTGVRGSISHTDDWCLVAVTAADRYRGLGVDIERLQPLDTATCELVLTTEEQTAMTALPAVEMEAGRCVDPQVYDGQSGTRSDVPPDVLSGVLSDVWPSVFFSLKESLFKCRFPIDRQWVNFQDVIVSVDPAKQQFSAVFADHLDNTVLAECTVDGKFCIAEGHVISVATLISTR